MNSESLRLWVIYRNPKDLPQFPFVVRIHEVKGGAHGPTGVAWGAQTLDDARSVIPPGLFCMNRDPADDPVIVESWL